MPFEVRFAFTHTFMYIFFVRMNFLPMWSILLTLRVCFSTAIWRGRKGAAGLVHWVVAATYSPVSRSLPAPRRRRIHPKRKTLRGTALLHSFLKNSKHLFLILVLCSHDFDWDMPRRSLADRGCVDVVALKHVRGFPFIVYACTFAIYLESTFRSWRSTETS